MLYNETILKKEAIIRPIHQFLERNKDGCETIVFILPIQLLTRSHDSQSLSDLEEFLDQTMNIRKNIQLFFIPTIYGPWQPNTFLFQQTILSKISMNEEINDLREFTMDALFIEDALETIIDIIESRIPGKYLIESGKKNHWDLCAAFLNIDGKLINTRERVSMAFNNEMIKVPLRKVTSISDSLSIQIEHTQRLYDNIIK
jgi:hypothetical protein